ncbi:MAG: hypothetical protein AAF497_11865 [Planctomycetota bacterium]
MKIHIQSGYIIVIDPMFVHYAQSPRREGTAPFDANVAFEPSKGTERLLTLQATAMGLPEPGKQLDVVGYFQVTPGRDGTHSFGIEDIRRVDKSASIEITRQFSVDSGQILVFDAAYLNGVMRHFSWRQAYNHLNEVDRQREREDGQLIAGRDDVYVQIQSPGINCGVEFTGDGEYYFCDGAF